MFYHETKVYRPKRLIDGKEVGQTPGTSWVAVPEGYSKQPFQVTYGKAKMYVKDWQTEAAFFKKQKDKWATGYNGRPTYFTLGYFEFKPEEE